MKWTTSHHTYWNSKAVFPVRTVILYVCMCAHVHLQLEIRTDLKLYPQQFSSVAQSCPILCDPMNFQQARPPCPSQIPAVNSNSHPSSLWCHPAISFFVVPFSSCPQPLPASESLPISQLFAWGGQSTGVSALASFLPKNTQDWSPLEWTDWISLQSKGL